MGRQGGKTSKVLKIRDLCSKDATMYRALTARASYLSQDRSDIKFAVKELASGMAKPTTKNWEDLKKLGRYLTDKCRSVLRYSYQKYIIAFTFGRTPIMQAVQRLENQRLGA